jgi:hypothetical protein
MMSVLVIRGDTICGRFLRDKNQSKCQPTSLLELLGRISIRLAYDAAFCGGVEALVTNRKTEILTTSVVRLSQSGVRNGFAVVSPSDVLNIAVGVSFSILYLYFYFVSYLCLPVAVDSALVRLVLVVVFVAVVIST